MHYQVNGMNERINESFQCHNAYLFVYFLCLYKKYPHEIEHLIVLFEIVAKSMEIEVPF